MALRIKKAIEKLKKKMKRRRSLLLAGWAALAIIAAVLYPQIQNKESEDSSVHSQPTAAQFDETALHEVVLHKLYLCGEQHESLGFYSEQDREALKQQHPEWTLEGIDGDKVVYFVEIEDLSPGCRNNAFFGLDHNDQLALYEGKPDTGKVIRTYFQVDLEHLESSMPKEALSELREGIQVTDFAEYNSVLSTFSDYALPGAEEVIYPEPQ